jgi:hypothetical protein
MAYKSNISRNDQLSKVLPIIYSYLAPQEFLNLSHVSKYARDLMDPNLPHIKRAWKTMRERMEFPDPAVIGLSDYSFFKTFYGSECSFCSDRSQKLKAHPMFYRYRLCNSCVKQYFVSEKELSCHSNYYLHLPMVHSSNLNPVEDKDLYRMYFKPDLPKSRPSKEVLEKRRNSWRENFLFDKKVWRARIIGLKNEYLSKLKTWGKDLVQLKMALGEEERQYLENEIEALEKKYEKEIEQIELEISAFLIG